MASRTNTRAAVVAPWATAAALLTLGLVSLSIGAADFSLWQIFTNAEARELFFISRGPRTMALVLTGAAMAVAGLIMQHLARNRFVSPTTAGTVESATLGVVVSLIWFSSAPLMAKVAVATVFALAGSTVFVLLIRGLHLKDLMLVPLVGLLLGGVMAAIAEFLAYRNNMTQSISAWFTGDFSGVIRGRYETLYLVGIAVVLAYLFAHQLMAASMGRSFAINLGVNYARTLAIGMALASFVTAVVVATVGAVPFLGLIVPNIITLLMGDNLRRILPTTAIAGAVLVLVCDIIGRLVIFPYEIPVGTIVGVLGAGVFLVLILRRGNYARD